MADVAVITGGSRGIGLASARALGARGLRVALLAPASSHLDDAASSLRAQAIDTLPVPCDVTSEASVEEASQRVHQTWGVPRVVIASAGIVRRAPVHEMSVDDWDQVMAVNLRGVFLTARAFLGGMRTAKRGRFVAIGSISATLGTANASAYNASKWGLIGLVKSIAEELHGTGVQALALNPGSVDTDMLRGSGYQAQMTPEDIAKLVVFAALDAPDAVNGAAWDSFGP